MDLKTKRVFKFVFITLFVDLLAFTLILPLLPKILDYYSINDKSGSYQLFNDNVEVLQKIIAVPESHNQVLLAGILGSWFSLLQFISSPFIGAMSDYFGRKIVLILTMLGTTTSYLIWLNSSNSFTLFIVSRTIGGLCKANVGLSLAIISDVSNENTRGKGMAIVGSSFSLAFIFGPLLGAFMSSLAKTSSDLETQLISNPSLVAIFLSLIDLALVIAFLEETNVTKKNSQTHLSIGNKTSMIESKQKIHDFPSNPFHFIDPRSLFTFKLIEQKTDKEAFVLKRSAFIYFYYLLFYSGLENIMPFMTFIKFNFTSMDQGKLFLFSGLLMALIQGGYIRRLKGGKESTMAYLGLILIVPSFMIMGLARNVSEIYISLALNSFASALVVPCITTIVSSQSNVNNRGIVMGTFRSIGALARALGPIVTSIMFWTLGSTLCYLIGALALIIPQYLMKDLRLKLKESDNIVDKKREIAKAN